MPEESEEIKAGYEELMTNISLDLYSTYLDKVINEDPAISKQVLNLKRVSNYIEKKFRPIHWRVSHPNVTAMGGFDVVLTNPPWDKIKATREEFFSDYIDGYANMETKDAIALSDALLASHPDIKAMWDEHCKNIDDQNRFYSDYYKYQTAINSQGKVLKGDANLFKVFIEKIYQILRPDGVCGMVVPDNLNIDSGCTGLRHLLLNQSSIKELIMFENKNKLFDIHDSQLQQVILPYLISYASRLGFYFIFGCRSGSRTLGKLKSNFKTLAPTEFMKMCKGEHSSGSSTATSVTVTGYDFEQTCASLLLMNNFNKVEVTKKSGDQGIDILAEKDGVKYAIQCKYYTSPVGNNAVQEAFAGKAFYGCHVAVVMTNSTFSDSARQLASQLGVVLWDGQFISELQQKAK